MATFTVASIDAETAQIDIAAAAAKARLALMAANGRFDDTRLDKACAESTP